MGKLLFLGSALILSCVSSAWAQKFETDTVETSAGSLQMTFIGHGTLMFTFDEHIWTIATAVVFGFG